VDQFMRAALAEARAGRAEGGIPIGSVLVHEDRVIGSGHNRRVQQGSVTLHGEMDALENAGRLAAEVYRHCTLYTTLSPCPMCTGAILLYGIPRVVIGENRSFLGEEALLRQRGVDVTVLDAAPCYELMQAFIAAEPTLWNEDIGKEAGPDRLGNYADTGVPE
jgi:cytosine/creatinine deaminase